MSTAAAAIKWHWAANCQVSIASTHQKKRRLVKAWSSGSSRQHNGIFANSHEFEINYLSGCCSWPTITFTFLAHSFSSVFRIRMAYVGHVDRDVKRSHYYYWVGAFPFFVGHGTRFHECGEQCAGTTHTHTHTHQHTSTHSPNVKLIHTHWQWLQQWLKTFRTKFNKIRTTSTATECVLKLMFLSRLAVEITHMSEKFIASNQLFIT